MEFAVLTLVLFTIVGTWGVSSAVFTESRRIPDMELAELKRKEELRLRRRELKKQEEKKKRRLERRREKLEDEFDALELEHLDRDVSPEDDLKFYIQLRTKAKASRPSIPDTVRYLEDVIRTHESNPLPGKIPYSLTEDIDDDDSDDEIDVMPAK